MGARRILVTGAEVPIGTAVRQHLAGRYELTSLTLTEQAFPSHVADISDLDAIRPAFEGVEAVVHLATSAGLETAWDDVLRSTSSAPATSSRRPAWRGLAWCSRPRTTSSACTSWTARRRCTTRTTGEASTPGRDRPDSLYGVSKAFGEALGRMYMERHGLRVFCLRIGAVRAHDDPTSPTANP